MIPIDPVQEILAALGYQPSEATKICGECGEPDGRHADECYHSDCDEDDWAVHGCGPLKTEPDLA